MKNTKKLISLSLAIAMSTLLFAGCQTAPGSVSITSAADLDGLKIGCQSGTTGEAWVLENCTKKEPKGFKSGMDAALDLKNGNLDAVVLDELPAKAIVSKNSDLKILDVKLSDKEEYAIAVAKGNTELVNAINTTIKKIKDNGDYDALLKAFMPEDGTIVIPADIESTGTEVIKMGTNAAFPPFEYVEGTKIVGFDVSMSQHIAADLGKKLEIADMNFDSLVAALQAGTIDMAVAGMSITEDKLKNVDFSDPYYESQQVIIVKK